MHGLRARVLVLNFSVLFLRTQAGKRGNNGCGCPKDLDKQRWGQYMRQSGVKSTQARKVGLKGAL